MPAWLRELSQGLLDLLLPPVCVACRAPAARHLCDRCLGSIARMRPPLCRYCGRPLDGGPFSLCQRCRESPPAFTACRAVGPYADPLRLAIHALKYDCKTAVVPALGELMAATFAQETALHEARVVVPVPLHPRRLRQRGFNQSELLARELARLNGIEVSCGLLARSKVTRPQVGLNAAQRRENVRDAFAVVAEPPRVPLLLVDDVITTGSTFHECATVLLAAGVPAVYALALAHD